MGRDWLPMRSAVDGASIMNEFAPYAMQAPPVKRRTRQRFAKFYNSILILYYLLVYLLQMSIIIHPDKNPDNRDRAQQAFEG